MTNPIPSLTENQKAKLLAQIKLEDSFDGKAISALNAFSPNIVPHMTDYFALINDLRFNLGEEIRKVYFDYSFVLFPLHKAFECYLNGVFSVIFEFEISKSKTAGTYLGLDDAKKDEILEKLQKRPWGKKITKDKWIVRLNALNEQWKTNRNPLTHPEQERVQNLIKTEYIAGALIREIEVSLKLFMEEFLDPLVAHIREQEKRESVKKVNSTIDNSIIPDKKD